MDSQIKKSKLIEFGLESNRAEWLLEQLKTLPKKSPPHKLWSLIINNLIDAGDPFELHKYFFSKVFEKAFSTKPPPPAWVPDQSTIKNSNVDPVRKSLGLSSYSDLYHWSIRNKAEFWQLITEKLDIQFSQEPSTILDTTRGVRQPVWYKGAEMNIVTSCFNRPDQSTAVLFQQPGGKIESYSTAQLSSLTFRIANGLKARGIGRRDNIAIAMPMSAEAVAIYLAVIAVGATAITIADSFAEREIAARLNIAPAKLIFTQDIFQRQGKELSLYSKIKAINSPPAVVVSIAQKPPVLRSKDLLFSDFLVDNDSFVPVPCQPDEPISIIFSSGTTSEPKAILWDHTTPIKSAADGYLHHNLQPNDIVCWPTNLGWMMGPWLVFAGLINKATMALYYDAPLGRPFGEFVQNGKVTMLGIVPSMVKAWKSSQCMEGLDWSAIKAFSSTGESSDFDTMFYLMYLANYRPVIEYCGGTEVGGGYVTGTVVQPSVPSCFSTPALGSEITILDERGKVSDRGEVFLVPPAVGLSQKLLNKNHDDIYYKDTPPGANGRLLRRHGDEMQRFENGYYKAHGRVDDTMNLGGIKVSSIQIEQTVNKVQGIKESAAIAVSSPSGGPNLLVIYAVLNEESLQTQQLVTLMQQAIRSELNPLFKISDVVIRDKLPRTASNKVMRRLLRSEYLAKSALRKE